MQTVFAPPLLHCACLERVPAMMFASVHVQQRACHLCFHKSGRRRALSRATRRMRRGAVWSKRETHIRSAQCFILTEADGAFRGFSDRNWRHQEQRDRRTSHERGWSVRCTHSDGACKRRQDMHTRRPRRGPSRQTWHRSWASDIGPRWACTSTPLSQNSRRIGHAPGIIKWQPQPTFYTRSLTLSGPNA